MPPAVVLLAFALSATVGLAATRAPDEGRLGSAVLPGGVEGLRRALDDRVTMPPAMVGVEVARRFHNGTTESAASDAMLARLRAWLQRCQDEAGCGANLASDAVPLPGSREFWRASVFAPDRAAAETIPAILGDRRGAWLYTALVSLDTETRAWLLARPALVRRLSDPELGALVVAAPWLGLDHGRWRLPGGREAEPIWADLVGVPPGEADRFLPALVGSHDGLIAYMLEVVGTLSPEQQAAALGPPRSGSAAARAMLSAMGRAADSWRPGQRPFSRPGVEPAFLLAQIPVDAGGTLGLPGGRRFWELAFGSDDISVSAGEARAAWDDREPVSAAWLVARVADAPPSGRVVRYEQALHASRQLAAEPASRAADVMTTVRAHARFPQLVRVLERAGASGAERLAAMVRKAAALTEAGDGWRARAAMTQWQGTLALLDRAVASGAMDAPRLNRAIDMLADAGDWRSWLAPLAPECGNGGDAGTRRVERALLARVTGAAAQAHPRVTWEGAQYRVDIAAGERDRLAHVRGRDDRPLIDSACALAALAVAAPVGSRDARAAEALAAVSRLAAAAGVDRPLAPDDELGHAARDAAMRARRRLVADGERPASATAFEAVDDLAHALAAAAVVELVYAAHLGWAEDLPLTAATASRRHRFFGGGTLGRASRHWAPPVIVNDRRSPWHVVGSVLGLDAALAPVALRRTSRRPLPAAPLLNTGDRALLVATAAVARPTAFTAEAGPLLDRLVARAHERLAAVSGTADARSAAIAAGVSPARQALAEWVAVTDRSALGSFFSLGELVRLGLDGTPLPAALAGWGNYDLPVSGRADTGPPPSLPWERYAGRARRTLAVAVPDLQLALALRLTEMDLPAALVPWLMKSAMLDLVNTAPSRHTDDWLALVAHVQAFDRHALERHLGLLTTRGPLRHEPPSAEP